MQTAILIIIYVVWPNTQHHLLLKYVDQLRTEPATAMGPGVEGEDEDADADEDIGGIELSLL